MIKTTLHNKRLPTRRAEPTQRPYYSEADLVHKGSFRTAVVADLLEVRPDR